MKAVALALLLAPSLALAQAAVPGMQTNVDVQHFKPSPDAEAFFTVESAELEPSRSFDLGLSFNYVKSPLVLLSRETGAQTGAYVDHRVDLNLLASIGIAGFLEAGIDLPLVVDQSGFTNLGLVPAPTPQKLSTLGVADLRAMLKLRVLDEARHGLSVAVLPILSLPTGKDFTGSGGVGVLPELVVSRRFGPARLGLNLGYDLKRPATLGSLEVGSALLGRLGAGFDLGRAGLGAPVELIGEVYGSTFASAPFAQQSQSPVEGLLGARYTLPVGLALQLGAGRGLDQGYGAPSFRVFGGLAFSPPVAAPVRTAIPPDTDGDGLDDATDKCPSVPGPKSLGGCPVPDTDGDGLADDTDRCPQEAGPAARQGCPAKDQDGDGLLDEDDACPREAGPKARRGCPIPDRDQDGVEDSADACPDERGLPSLAGCPFRDRDDDGLEDAKDACPAEAGVLELKGCPVRDQDHDGVPDHQDNCLDQPGPASNQGCPEAKKQLVVITTRRLEIKEKVFFATGRSTILAKSFELLNQVAKVIDDHPNVCPLEVAGHTDSQGSAQLNRKLSQDRAAAVRDYLVKRGVKAECLRARGYGPDRPIGDNKSAAGRELNRRVEFNLGDPEDDALPFVPLVPGKPKTEAAPHPPAKPLPSAPAKAAHAPGAKAVPANAVSKPPEKPDSGAVNLFEGLDLTEDKPRPKAKKR